MLCVFFFFQGSGSISDVGTAPHSSLPRAILTSSFRGAAPLNFAWRRCIAPQRPLAILIWWASRKVGVRAPTNSLPKELRWGLRPQRQWKGANSPTWGQSESWTRTGIWMHLWFKWIKNCCYVSGKLINFSSGIYF